MDSIIGIQDTDLDVSSLVRRVYDDRCGAVVTFQGVVRNHDRRRSVRGIEYVAHPSATQVLREIVMPFTDRAGVHRIVAQHRVGWLEIGGLALVVAVASEHRKGGFTCIDDLVDEIKDKLPVWKRQVFTDGSHEWSRCP